VVTGGMESMSNAPYLLAKARGGLRIGHTDLKDAMFLDGLEDAETGRAMGTFAQDTADAYQLTRQAMDAYAIGSLERARAAIASGALATEIAPIEIGGASVGDDEQPHKAKLERIATLKPAFKADGTITAANSSSISDGASALVVVSDDRLNGIEPLARIAGQATHSQHPREFTTAPIGVIDKLLRQLGWKAEDVDLFEINEAFAMVTMLAISELGLDPARVNIYGGACAQGHPIGSTGSRLIVTLAHAMKAHGKRRGIAALCIGGGEATAVALERN
jgi:acetyl-CoA C-acetyltransferase